MRKSPALYRRWGEVLVMAGGPDMRADPKTGWLSWDLTKQHFRERGRWDGAAGTWDAAWTKCWSEGVGPEWSHHGFMRGNISWFYGAPQESLATQGNKSHFAIGPVDEGGGLGCGYHWPSHHARASNQPKGRTSLVWFSVCRAMDGFILVTAG